jgi:hypothetical protein
MQVTDLDGNVMRLGSEPLAGEPFGPCLDMHGRSWPPESRVAFLEAATWHGPLAPAEAILAAHPQVAGGDIQSPIRPPAREREREPVG